MGVQCCCPLCLVFRCAFLTNLSVLFVCAICQIIWSNNNGNDNNSSNFLISTLMTCVEWLLGIHLIYFTYESWPQLQFCLLVLLLLWHSRSFGSNIISNFFSFFFHVFLFLLTQRLKFQFQSRFDSSTIELVFDNELYLRNGWLIKGFKPYCQLRPLLEILTIANLRHAKSRIWISAEPEFRLCWMKLRSIINNFTKA